MFYWPFLGKLCCTHGCKKTTCGIGRSGGSSISVPEFESSPRSWFNWEAPGYEGDETVVNSGRGHKSANIVCRSRLAMRGIVPYNTTSVRRVARSRTVRSNEQSLPEGAMLAGFLMTRGLDHSSRVWGDKFGQLSLRVVAFFSFPFSPKESHPQPSRPSIYRRKL